MSKNSMVRPVSSVGILSQTDLNQKADIYAADTAKEYTYISFLIVTGETKAVMQILISL